MSSCMMRLIVPTIPEPPQEGSRTDQSLSIHVAEGHLLPRTLPLSEMPFFPQAVLSNNEAGKDNDAGLPAPSRTL